jgi:hypothetical protein
LFAHIFVSVLYAIVARPGTEEAANEKPGTEKSKVLRQQVTRKSSTMRQAQ